MHPFLMDDLARQRSQDLCREAGDVRRRRALRATRAGGRGVTEGAARMGLRQSVRTALGNRLVSAGGRLLEAGLPRAQAVAPAPLPCRCNEGPC